MLSFKRLLTTVVLTILVVGCTANAPADLPCKRTCGSRTVSGGKLVAMPLTGSFGLECSGSGNALGPFEIQFLIYEDNTPAGSGGADGSSSASSNSSIVDTVNSKTPKRIPKGGVAVYPSIGGVVGSGSSHGTLTPASDWCTDSCGIATLMVQPTCVQQEFNVGLVVPGLTGEATAATATPVTPVKITITIPE